MNTASMSCYTATAAESVWFTTTCSSSSVCVLHSYVLPIYTSRPYMTKQSYCTRPQQTNIRGQTYFTKEWLWRVIDFWKFDWSISNSCYRKTSGFINRVLLFFPFLFNYFFFLSSFLLPLVLLALIFPLVHRPVILNPY